MGWLHCDFPSGRYRAAMTENLTVRSALPKILARQRLTVADLIRRIEESGLHFDKKTIYRLASGEPVRTLNLPAVTAIGRALKLRDPGKLLLWTTASSPRPQLRRIDAETQARLDELMAKNTEGSLSTTERRELEKLGRQVETLSLENAHLLASHASGRKPGVARGQRREIKPDAARRRGLTKTI